MVDNKDEIVPSQDMHGGGSETESTQLVIVTETVHRSSPLRKRRKPAHLQEFETEDSVDKLQTCMDSCHSPNLHRSHNVKQV